MKLYDALKRFSDDHPETAAGTLRGYHAAVASLDAHGIKTTQHLTRERLSAWIAQRRDEGVLDTTIITQLGGVLSIASHLERVGLFPLTRLRHIRRVRPRRPTTPPPDYLSREEWARLRLAARAEGEWLDVAVGIALFCGLRLNEIRRLHREDLRIDGEDAEAPYLRVGYRHPTKTRRPRTVPIAKPFAADLRARELPPGPIFPPRNALGRGPYMHEQTFKRGLMAAREASGVERGGWSLLRHTFASHVRQHGIGLSVIAGLLGNTRRVAEEFYASIGNGADVPRIDSAFAERANAVDLGDARHEVRPTGTTG